MARLTKEMESRAAATISMYPHPRSALIPLLHLLQEQDGYVTEDGMAHVAALVGITPADVYGTASFYEMFKFHPVGTYLLNVCTNISCMLQGGSELLEHLEDRLEVAPGGTTADGTFTLEEVECIAACTQAPCLLANYRTFGPLTTDAADALLDDLRSGRLSATVPPHGTLNSVRRQPAMTAPSLPGKATPTVPAAVAGAMGPASKDETAPVREVGGTTS
jgi:NADH-quinone oxidoreductase E subunit